MNRRTALGAIAASPVLVASAGASPAIASHESPKPSFFEKVAQGERASLAEKCFIALVSYQVDGREAAARAFEMADAFNAEMAIQCSALRPQWPVR